MAVLWIPDRSDGEWSLRDMGSLFTASVLGGKERSERAS